jgi:hypothetical protein
MRREKSEIITQSDGSVVLKFTVSYDLACRDTIFKSEKKM